MDGWSKRWRGLVLRRWSGEGCFSYFHMLLSVAGFLHSNATKQIWAGLFRVERELSAAQYRQDWLNLPYSPNILTPQRPRGSVSRLTKSGERVLWGINVWYGFNKFSCIISFCKMIFFLTWEFFQSGTTEDCCSVTFSEVYAYFICTDDLLQFGILDNIFF